MAVAHRIYADALFGAAKDAGRLAEVHESLADFAAAIAQTPELRSVLRNPQLDPTAKAEILKALDDSYDFGIAALKEQTDATMLQTVQGPAFLGASSRERIAYFVMIHANDIYGQMAVYLRLNGIVPPASHNSM